VVLQNAVFSLYGYWLRRKRYNNAFKNACRILSKNELLSHAEHSTRQLSALKKILVHGALHVPYYQRLFQKIKFDPEKIERLDDLHKIPLLEKKDVLNNSGDLIAGNIKTSNMIIEETSGTSGTPLKVWWHKEFYPWIYALYEQRMRGSAGVSRWHRKANFTGKVLVHADQQKPPFWRYNSAENQLYMSSYHLRKKNIPCYVNALQKFKPVFIIGYPGSMYPVARYLASTGDNIPSLKSVISCSEYLSAEVRTVLEKGFGCNVYNHYGSVEWTATLNECEAGRLHESPEFGIIEILDETGNPVPKGETGEMVCTGLLNYAMPFIRYRTGDMGSFTETDEQCPCGRKLPHLKTLEGRKMSFISLPHNGTVSSASLSTAFHADHILESQLIQDSADSVKLKLVVTDGFKDTDREHLLAELLKRISPLSIQCEYVDAIPRERGGKNPWIINRVLHS